MSNYRRVKIEGAWYFFTVVTYKRRSYSTYHRFCEQGMYDDFDWNLFQTDDQMEFIE